MINLQFVTDYMGHRLLAKTRHGVHSPFVYKLVDEVIYDLGPRPAYSGIEKIRRQLLHDDRTITITDMGAGSHVNNNKKKKVRQLAKNALKPPRLAQLIHRLANVFRPLNIIELGTCLGITTAYLAKAAPQAAVISVEGCPQTAAIAAEVLEKAEARNVILKVGNFDELLPDIINQQEKLDFVFIDGNHRKEATLNYFRLCLPRISENSVLIFDDIYWSKGMKEAWQLIKDHPEVSLSIDLFWIGLVFFRKGQQKEHFKIKF